jgi:hypothetical protein
VESKEIKFKAWHKSDEKMYEVYGFSKNQWFIKGKRFPMPPGALNLLQYTGLKDRNKLDVFEGDIVRCTRGCPHEVIRIKEYGGTFSGGMPAWYLSGIKAGYAWTGQEEVIGNIFENPNLLEA